MSDINSNVTAINTESGEVTEAAPYTGPKLATGVTYVDSNGREKAALVIGTPESVSPGHSIPVPEGNGIHVLVFGFKEPYQRMNVQPQDASNGGSFYKV